ncbi:mitochondrial carrier [Hyphopichia burtonii NRRL Y-1933]|uniref:Mitochondrial thiamine pyrophosphate carrier 1 n=1 Tax=Hyphopichia burtonii NRRL Y-1933 TaxID=984485 RepID=A0A1E4RCH0_9ASCO|nr:mitochondrial carrier [Hyphopichia burtonii NRRL Y-1933]ODV64954.1 mitochondrial carrier [Hyphopichia burtonii NRRL Y-1933]
MTKDLNEDSTKDIGSTEDLSKDLNKELSKDLSTKLTTVPDDYQVLFKKLDILHNGEITINEFTKALQELNHPISDKPELISQVFKSFDSNHDKIIDFNDFKLYLTTTDDQILKGFNKIDQDNDGKLNKSDFITYLKKSLNLDPSIYNIDKIFNTIDYKNDGYITYDEFRYFLILMPRLHGSRIKTAITFIAEELDLSSDGDVTLINQFLNGFGFFLAGGLSGVVSRTCTAPFDRIKIFLIARTDLSSTVLHSKKEIARQIANGASQKVVEEARKKMVAAEEAAAKQAAEHPKTIRSPIIQAARTLWKQGGIKTFYVGNGLNVLKVFPESAMKFGSFEATKRFLAKIEGLDDTTKLSKALTYLAGGLGGVCAQFTVYPIDTLKFRLQCSNIDSSIRGNALLIKTAKDMFKEGGLRIFYRGIFVGTSGIFPYAALDLGTFSTIKKWLVKRESKKYSIPEDHVKLPNYMVLSLGALSGTFGASVVYPINLLRTRLQAQGTYAHPYRYDGFIDVLQKTIAREGYPGLFKGLVPNLAKVAPAVSISYFMYENLKHIFRLDETLK